MKLKVTALKISHIRQLSALLLIVSASYTSMAATPPDSMQSSGQSFGYSLSGNAGDNHRPQLGSQSALNDQASAVSTTGSREFR